MDFLDAMRAEKDGSTWAPSGTAQEMIEAVDRAAERLMNPEPCPFAIGEYVTPRKHGSVKGRGKPYKVVKVYSVEYASGEHGAALEVSDMWCAVDFPDKDIKVFPQRSEDFELFDREKADS